jgi:nitrogen-specific signal transduction histidine kinase
MKFFPKGSWSYAVLLVILFSLAAVAAKWIVDLVAERFLSAGYEDAVQEVSVSIWLLTMGFMFLAGALGLFGMSATAEYESRHRIARIVNAMNNLSDGLLALDFQGRIKGANPAARRLISARGAFGKMDELHSAFPALSPEDKHRLLNKNTPSEIEIESFSSTGLRMLRLRSQPAEGLILVFISDITDMHTATIQQQQNAKLQVLGRIAGGVAHDFSNILSGISGHAALIQRFNDDKRSLSESVDVIINETQRGIRLSRQLLALSRSSDLNIRPSGNLDENINEAKELVRVALSAAWKVEAETTGSFPLVPFSPAQIEQIIVNLSLLAADSLRKPGRLMIQLTKPVNIFHVEGMLPQDFKRFAAIILISASVDEDTSDFPAKPREQASASGIIDTTGIIPSVVKTLIEGAGGRLDELYASSTKVIYRVCLPHASDITQVNLVSSRRRYNSMPNMNGLKVVLGSEEKRYQRLEKIISDIGAVFEKKTSVESVLESVDAAVKPDIIIVEKSLLGADADGLLKAIRKICPHSGMVVISRKLETEELRKDEAYIFVEYNADDDTWLNAILKARQSISA